MKYKAGLLSLLTLVSTVFCIAGVEWVQPDASRGRGAEQAVARFPSAMVAFGDPQPNDPFVVDCPVKGKGFWSDPWNWAYDFDQPLPGGLKCTFRPIGALRPLDGSALAKPGPWTLSTGGPSFEDILPSDGDYSQITEDQVFILRSSGPLDSAKIAREATCRIDETEQSMPVQVISAKQLYDWQQVPFTELRYFSLLEDQRSTAAKSFIALRCAKPLPSGQSISLVLPYAKESYGGDEDSYQEGEDDANKGIETLHYQVRQPFTAEFNCTKVNSKSGCVPFLGMDPSFNVEIKEEDARKIQVLDSNGQVVPGLKADAEKGDVIALSIRNLSPRARYTLSLPNDLRDIDGRSLGNAGKFPLKFRTDDYPALAKFGAKFGILELNNPTLPLHLRNVEQVLSAKKLVLYGKQLKLGQGMDGKVRSYFNLMDSTHTRNAPADREEYPLEGEFPLLRPSDGAEPMTVQRTLNGNSTELTGIPLKEPGFYVIEVESPKLGSDLFEKPNQPYYIQTSVLVTNMSVHLKLGKSNGLVWVTSLDKGLPIAEANLRATDCAGKTLWQGRSNAQGLAKLAGQLGDNLQCPLMVSASKGDDYSFVMSDWNQGLDSWNFLRSSYGYDEWGGREEEDGNEQLLGHTILDRSLFRAGETVHMKHFLRWHRENGIDFPPSTTEYPSTMTITHFGSDEEFEIPLQWDHARAMSTWEIPKTAKTGTYQIRINGVGYATFRVEEFRVPLMNGEIIAEPVFYGKDKIPVEFQVNYLNGGGAAGLPIIVRAEWSEDWEAGSINDPRWKDFSFGGSEIKTGLRQNHRYEEQEDEDPNRKIKTKNLTLDQNGNLQVPWDILPEIKSAQSLQLQMEYRDPSGAVQFAYHNISVRPTKLRLGINEPKWSASKDTLIFKVVAVDEKENPKIGQKIQVNLYQTKTYSHRKRLFGGFYGYDNTDETLKLDGDCSGKTNEDGFLTCKVVTPKVTSLQVQAKATDESDLPVYANQSVWSDEYSESWYGQTDNDRIDLIPTKAEFQVGENAKFEIRSPFHQATALITIEREGIIQEFVREFNSDNPFVEFPVTEEMGPNAYISVFLVRGRVEPEATGFFSWIGNFFHKIGEAIGIVEPKTSEYAAPTAFVDLAKPSFKMGLREFKVAYGPRKLDVQVKTDKQEYHPRDSATVEIQVNSADAKALENGEVAIAVVDEGLLQLEPNSTWDVLSSMYPNRSLEVQTATAQSLVIGKRHFGRKTLAPGGGGGSGPNRELFETLLFWKGDVKLDANGHAKVKFRLNDALTSFRIVAIANSGAQRFGTGTANISNIQNLSLISGLPPVARSGDQMEAEFTLRNSTDQAQTITINGAFGPAKNAIKNTLPAQSIEVPAKSSKSISWMLNLPKNIDSLYVQINASAASGAKDRILVGMDLIPGAMPKVQQSALFFMDSPKTMPVQRPADAVPGEGSLRLILSSRIGDQLDGVQKYMQLYPHRCMEQQVSRAISLRDTALWNGSMAALPNYLDLNGLVRYFPSDWAAGSEILSAYILSVSRTMGWEIPESSRERIIEGLINFAKTNKQSSNRYWRSPDLSLRRVMALSAIARYQPIEPSWMGGIQFRPEVWPTVGLIDWMELWLRSPQLPGSVYQVKLAMTELRKRYRYQGSAILFNQEQNDNLWWLMSDPDVNAIRLFAMAMQVPAWNSELPQMAQGLILRQVKGHWSSTVANAWGTAVLGEFARKFERGPVNGILEANYGNQVKTWDFAQGKQGVIDLPWQNGMQNLALNFVGTGRPWVAVQSIATVEPQKPRSLGYQIDRKIVPVRQTKSDQWSVGDIYTVNVNIKSKVDMGWVVFEDAIPSGSSILGSGLGGDYDNSSRSSGAWPIWEDRSGAYYRAYYQWVPKGDMQISYSVRIGQKGKFRLPPTRIEAMYLPSMFGELPVTNLVVQ